MGDDSDDEHSNGVPEHYGHLGIVPDTTGWSSRRGTHGIVALQRLRSVALPLVAWQTTALVRHRYINLRHSTA